MALFATWSVAVTASPINSVINRISGHDTAGAQLVAAMMREMDINDRNQESFKADFDNAMLGFKEEYNIDGENKLETKNETNNLIVCPHHEAQLKTLGDSGLKGQWDKVDAALNAKVALLAQIRDLLNDDDDDDQGLHCGANNSAGAGELCDLLTKLDEACSKERIELNGEKTILDAYIKNIENYVCDCKMGAWGDWSECAGQTVQSTTVWTSCNEKQTEDHEDNKNCFETAKCGNGTQSVTRKQVWAPKNNGKACDAKGDSTQTVNGENVDGVLSELGADTNQQTFTRDCSEGYNSGWNGACPVDCVWGAWDGKFEDQDCAVDSCTHTNGSRKTNTRSVTRGKTTEKAYGGKPCFAIQDGAEGSYWTDTKSETCEYEDAVVHEKAQLVHETTKLTTKARKLMTAMCKGDNGPCQHNGTCQVEYNTDEEDVTKWCECSDGYTGDWCEKAVWKSKLDYQWSAINGFRTLKYKTAELRSANTGFLDECKTSCLAGENKLGLLTFECNAFIYEFVVGPNEWLCSFYEFPAPIPEPTFSYELTDSFWIA